VPYVAFTLRNEKSAADLWVRGAGCNQGRPIVSCCSSRHAAGLWLTNEDGEQDAEENDEEDEFELHLLGPRLRCRVRNRNFMLETGFSAYDIAKRLSRARRVAEETKL
jgi:hypothetical protein